MIAINGPRGTLQEASLNVAACNDWIALFEAHEFLARILNEFRIMHRIRLKQKKNY